jgi:hypothetical protein
MNFDRQQATQFSMVVLAAIAAAACISRLNTGFSSLDDGFYAYAAAATLEGKTIHRDFFSQYVGYQHYLHAAFFYWFGEDYLTLRFPLILTQFLASVSAAAIFKRFGPAYQVVAILVTTGLGILLFRNPSTSWTCVALTLALIAVLSSTAWAKRPRLQLLFVGLLLGLMFGVRHPTAIFVGMGVLVQQIICAKEHQAAGGNWQNAAKLVMGILLLATLAALVAYMVAASTFMDMLPWFCAPITYLCYSLFQIRHKDCVQPLFNLALIGAGFVVALCPWLISTTVQNNWAATFIDLRTMPAHYSSMLELTTADYAGNLIYVFVKLLDAKSALGLLISLTALAFPAFVSICILLSGKYPRLRQWITSPLCIIATFHTLVIIAVITIVYSAYIIAIELLALLLLFSSFKTPIYRKVVLAVFAGTSFGTFFFLSNQYEGGVGVAYFGGGDRLLSKCWLPRCNLFTIASNNRIATEAYEALDKIKTPDSTVVSLPWGYHYQFSYPSQPRPPYPDVRLPLYRQVPPQIAYDEIFKTRDPVILIEKFAMRDESVYPEFAEYFARDFLKAYDSPAFMILVKKDR